MPAATRLLMPRRWRDWSSASPSMAAREQRNQVLLLVAAAIAVLPHLWHVPPWAAAAFVGLWLWRAWLTHGLKAAPHRLLILSLLVVLTAGVWLSHGALWGRDASIHLLLMLVGLKMLELRATRDIFVIVFLTLFVLQTEFLYDQSPLALIQAALVIVLLLTVMLGTTLTAQDLPLRRKFGVTGRMLVLSMPLAVALFFLFPRLSIPSWGYGSAAAPAGTGLSHSMTPGAIGHLLRNDAIAMRVQFTNGAPPPSAWYWRGPVLGFFDGRTWSPPIATELRGLKPAPVQLDPGSDIDYTVTLEPTEERELLALGYPVAVDGVDTRNGRLNSAYELRSATPIAARRRYDVHAYLRFRADPDATPANLAGWLQLPLPSNPRTRAWAQALRAAELERKDLTGADRSEVPEARLVSRVLDHLRREDFHYNIDAPLLEGDDRIDQFFFSTRTGFCEHYASTFVFIMRSLGIPARVVTGYLGGEPNPVDGYVTVRQSDAHAWAEVWLSGRGWVRVDPTAAVAPERVDKRLSDLTAANATGGTGWLRRWRFDREAMENAWNQWVLSYSPERQRRLLSMFGMPSDLRNLGLLATLIVAALLGVMVRWGTRLPRETDALTRAATQLRDRLRRAGIEVPDHLGNPGLAHYLQDRLEPGNWRDCADLLNRLQQVRYAPPPTSGRHEPDALVQAMRRWRPRPTLRSPSG